MNNKKTILRNVFSSLTQQITATIYGFIIPILLIKSYGSEVNGLISSINQFLSYIVLLEFGIGPIIKVALFKPLVKKDKKQIEKVLGATNSYFKKISLAFIIYIIILCFVYPNFVNNFDKVYVVSLMLIIVISRFFEYFIGMTYRLFLQAEQKNYIIDYTMSITYILSLIVIFCLVKLNCNIHIVKFASALIYVIRPLALKLYFHKKYNYKFVKDKKYKFEQQWDGLFHHIASVVHATTDSIVLTLFSNLINVSIYSVYYLIVSSMRTIITAFTNGMDAFFGKLLIKSNNIKEKFKEYCLAFYTITTILLSCTLVLIIPFIELYTQNITDANYINEAFGYILVFAEFVFIIRYPYSTIVYAKGDFKQTRNFSIIEPIVNIILSVTFVIKFGLVGVAMGTLISMFIRTFGFIIYATKNILKNKLLDELKIIIVSFIQMLTVFIVHLIIGNNITHNYLEWIIYAIIVFTTISVFIVSTNFILFKKTFKNLLLKFKRKWGLRFQYEKWCFYPWYKN